MEVKVRNRWIGLLVSPREQEVAMKTLFLVALAAAIAGLASACAVRTQTVERPYATTTYVATAPAPVVYYYY